MNQYYSNCILYDEYDNIMDNYFRSVEDGSRFLIEKIC
jgi:hypothetical protein